MTREILYMLGVIATGFAVNYTLRALPFLLFAGRDRELPAWALRLGDFLSPVIIAGLIVYSYTGLEWRTIWPYLAGVLTVGLQLWKRNALASIVAGTVLYMCLLNCGCATRQVRLDTAETDIVVTSSGLLFCGESVKPGEVPALLQDFDIPRDRVVHILLQSDVTQQSLAFKDAKLLMGELFKAGYRSTFVTPRQASSRVAPRASSEKNNGKVRP